MNLLKKISFLFIIFLSFSFVYAQGSYTNQGHDLSVTTIEECNNGFFSSGSDGFLIKWDNTLTGEHYQVSNIEIKMIACHPTKDEVAVYETDGFSIYRLSVWEWEKRKQKFSVRFTDSITSLEYSAKGTYLITGTSSVDGLFFLDSNNGKPIPILNDQIGATTLTKTSKGEGTCVLYSPSGFIYYADIKTGNAKATVDCTPYLENPILFSNNVFLAGTSYDGIELINAVDGTNISTISIIESPIFVTNSNDTDLFYIEYNNLTNNYELKVVFTSKQELNYEPIIVKKFKLVNDETISVAKKIGKNIYIGCNNGQLYKLPITVETEVSILENFTKKSYDKIIDIAEYNGTFLFLTNKNILASTYSEGTSTEIAQNNGSNKIISCGDKIILWTYNDKSPVYMLNKDGNLEIIYTPSKQLHTIRYMPNQLILVEGNSIVTLLNLNNKTNEKLYTGTGIQDAIICELNNKNHLIIAKTASSNPKSSLLTMDMETKEIVPLQVKPQIIFSLCENIYSSNSKPIFYGVSNSINGNKKTTEIFTYDFAEKLYTTIYYLPDEDTSAFINIYNDSIFTNIGKSNIRSIKLSNKKEFVFPRNFALAEKLVANDDYTLVLNKDGSLSWFSNSNNYIATWFYGLDESFIEF